jgi:hypothetical protein
MLPVSQWKPDINRDMGTGFGGPAALSGNRGKRVGASVFRRYDEPAGEGGRRSDRENDAKH